MQEGKEGRHAQEKTEGKGGRERPDILHATQKGETRLCNRVCSRPQGETPIFSAEGPGVNSVHKELCINDQGEATKNL